MEDTQGCMGRAQEKVGLWGSVGGGVNPEGMEKRTHKIFVWKANLGRFGFSYVLTLHGKYDDTRGRRYQECEMDYDMHDSKSPFGAELCCGLGST